MYPNRQELLPIARAQSTPRIACRGFYQREYANLGPAIEAAVKAYAADVRSRAFPGVENVYPMKKAQ